MGQVTKCLFCVCAVLCTGSLNLFAHSDSAALQLVVSSSGDVVTVWMGVDSASCRSILASRMSFGHNLADPVVISAAGIESFMPVIAMNDVGTTVVTWLGRNTSLGVVSAYMATLPAGGNWSSPEVISLPNETVDSIADVKIGNSNYITTVWRSISEPDHSFHIVVSTAALGGSWKRSAIARP